MAREKIINIAVIAHVDAGKSTLVDAFLNQSGVFRKNEEVPTLIMDSNDLEKERGITIYSKNCSVFYKDYKINIKPNNISIRIDSKDNIDYIKKDNNVVVTINAKLNKDGSYLANIVNGLSDSINSNFDLHITYTMYSEYTQK